MEFHAPVGRSLPGSLMMRFSSIVVGGPYSSGALVGCPNFEYAPAPPEILAKVARIKAVADRQGVSMKGAGLQFALANPVVAGTADGRHFTLSSVVDPVARTCDTRIMVSRAVDGDAFAEQHRQYFHTAAPVLDALLGAGFALTAVTDEYSHRPADASTLRATWTARRGAGGAHQLCEGGAATRGARSDGGRAAGRRGV